MTLGVFTHPACLAHEGHGGHPERPARLAAVMEALEAPLFAAVARIEAPRATRAQLARVHSESYLDHLFALQPGAGLIDLDPDTYFGPASLEAALRAAGAVCAAVDHILSGDFKRAFCAVRPPGHHAEPDGARGFCFFNNICIGALHALAEHQLSRVAIADFDVHHGNGSEAVCRSEPRCLYLSSHQSPLFPGSGTEPEMGDNIVNCTLEPGSGSAAFRTAWRDTLLPALQKFAPDMLFISTGFDGHSRDPLAQIELTTEDYSWLTNELVDVAKRQAQGRVVSVLEGGYDLAALKQCTVAHLAGMM